MYLAGWKDFLPVDEACTSPAGFLPVDEVHVPRRLEGNPSSRSLAGRLKGGYPRIPARIPAKAEGYPPGDADAAFPGKSNRISASARISGCNATISRIRIPWRVSAGPGGSPPADSGYPQRIIPAHLYQKPTNFSLQDPGSPFDQSSIQLLLCYGLHKSTVFKFQ
ncbi:hypothetical protein PGTUg99_025946 [Puccinia graminis f. sp. tritici]|uniref:Uncharacterized protein n=1 Tax=Puccinia graminis f. sp. tritici TaxID=56615 RepID=A0A5B0R8W4_PUCGR|nr:hypothetical protein PGTUg99_025946 [Puccinia graminis f. sp. tritici]